MFCGLFLTAVGLVPAAALNASPNLSIEGASTSAIREDKSLIAPVKSVIATCGFSSLFPPRFNSPFLLASADSACSRMSSPLVPFCMISCNFASVAVPPRVCVASPPAFIVAPRAVFISSTVVAAPIRVASCMVPSEPFSFLCIIVL